MASASDLIQILSDATGVPFGTVFDIDRWLVKGNLRPVGGRRFGAAKMKPLDAARMLTAILASPQSNKAAEAVQRYEQTRPDKLRSSQKLFVEHGLDDLSALAVRHGFVDGLAAIISSAAQGSLADYVQKSKAVERTSIEVSAVTNATHASIRVLDANVEYTTSIDGPVRSNRGKTKLGGDLRETRQITGQTIFMIARLFKERT
jgi:hypothetical protein